MKFKSIVRAAFWSFAIIYIASSCSNFSKISPEFEGIDERAKPYVDHIYKIGKIKGTVDDDIYNISLGFDDLPGTIVGTCRMTFFPLGQEITIDNSYWRGADEYGKFYIILHEYVHCYFHRLHTEELLPDGCPSSIMYPNVVYDVCGRRHFNRYINEALDN